MAKQKYFQKNCPSPESAQAEVHGLELLREKTTGIELLIPQVHKVQFNKIFMDYIVNEENYNQAKLGQNLARLHSRMEKKCGLSQNNFIGLTPQKNIESDDWGHFFLKYRIQYQINLLGWDPDLIRGKLLEKFLNKSVSGFSILHGDLWSGNFLYSEGEFYLIDPAVYYGDPEADLAMTELFGGFSKSFYEGYQEVRAISTEYKLKRKIYNLYHILNHANIFGGAYKHQAISLIKEINNDLDSGL